MEINVLSSLHHCMTFSRDSAILIKNPHLLKVSNATKLVHEFLDKGWKKHSLNKLLKKLRDTVTVDRLHAVAKSRVHALKNCEDNVDYINELMLCQA